MSIALEILLEKKQEKQNQMATLRTEIKEIVIAIRLLEGGMQPLSTQASGASEINAAILVAVKNGCKTPSAIFEYLEKVSGISTTKNSINTRLNKMKGELLTNDSSGWSARRKETPDVDASGAPSTGGVLAGVAIPNFDSAGSNPATSNEYHRDETYIGGDNIDDEIPF